MSAEPLDLDAIEPWLRLCGTCDAGLPVACTCQHGDYRRPMLALVREVKRLRKENERLKGKRR